MASASKMESSAAHVGATGDTRRFSTLEHQSDVVSNRDSEGPQALMVEPNHSAYQAPYQSTEYKGFYQVPAEQHEDDAMESRSFLPADKKTAWPTYVEVKPKRYLGMTIKLLLVFLAIVILVIIGIVVGVVLGLLLKRKPWSNTNAKFLKNGFAALPQGGMSVVRAADNSSSVLMYFENAQNKLVENIYANGQWSLQNSSLVSSSVLPFTISSGSSIEALTYYHGGVFTRQIFMVDPTGAVMTSNSTTPLGTFPSKWSTPVQLQYGNDISTEPSAGIAACVDNSTWGMNGIRAYYGSPGNGVIETVFQFNNTNGWVPGTTITGLDLTAGLSCTIYNVTFTEDNQVALPNSSGQNLSTVYGINLYARNLTTKTFQQLYTVVSDNTMQNYAFHSNFTSDYDFEAPVAPGAPIAACNDNSLNEYVYFQLPNGTIIETAGSPWGESNFTNQTDTYLAPKNAKLSATWFSTQRLLIYQNSTNTSLIEGVMNTRSDFQLSDSVVNLFA